MNAQLRALMGENMMEVETAAKALKLKLEPEVLDRFGEIPFPGQVLRDCAGSSGFELLPLFTLSISELGLRFPSAFFAQGQEAWWEKGVSFACHSGHPTWSLIRKDALFTVSGMRWNSRMVRSQIPSDEQPPSARVLVYRAIVHFLTSGKRWLENVYALSSDEVAGRAVCVGYHDGGGIDIALERDHMPCHKFAIVTEKKPLAASA